eukprot:comp22668_c1_seq3/m.35005 comp22668_c1_seq3/g.35005  ORF comp22668_c1_seq3/g.35005 comp22668_c1_seq3/m.35005 type:complete len:158 (-) comp22668_c1_seq3:633-1106(-)
MVKKECPVCHQRLLKDPYRCDALGRLVRAVARKMPTEDKDKYRLRLQEAEADDAAVKEIERTVGKADKAKTKFLNVVSAWTDSDREIFQKGVGGYRGRARRLYCALVNLKPETVELAQLQSLRRMLGNVGLKVPQDPTAEDCRAMLMAFIRGEISEE